MSLADRTCEPCRGGVPPLSPERIAELAVEVPGWSVEAGHHLRRALRFADFQAALACVNAIGAEAERQAHHPDFELGWGRVVVTLWTHAIDGLTEADFILAAKIDRLPAVRAAG